jgi:hypothetical protein
MHSDDNSEKLVMKLRIKDIYENEDDEESDIIYLKEVIDQILNDLTLSGIPEISKVTLANYNEIEYDSVTGGIVKNNNYTKNWML